MTGLSYEIVDVFTDRAYAGNPLAVVHGGDELSTAQMQAVAKEFNLSETVFALPATTSEADYRVRIFTPGSELPFAGHPSVGAAWALARAGVIRSGDVVQECGAGLLPVHVDERGARVTGGAPEVGAALDASVLAAAVGLEASDVEDAVPAGTAAAGVPYAFLPVNPDAVARAEVNPVALREALSGAGMRGHVGVAVVAFDRGAGRAHVRMFAPEVGVVEDPATGSAAVALGVFLVDRGVLAGEGTSEFTVAQGAEIGRPSRLDVTVEATAGVATRTSVGGRVAAIARGELIATPPAG